MARLKTSSPAPPSILSLPTPEIIVSFPAPPVMVSLPTPPVRLKLPSVSAEPFQIKVLDAVVNKEPSTTSVNPPATRELTVVTDVGALSIIIVSILITLFNSSVEPVSLKLSVS